MVWWKTENAFSSRNRYTSHLCVSFFLPSLYKIWPKQEPDKMTFACFFLPCSSLLLRPFTEYRTGTEKPFQIASDIPSFNYDRSVETKLSGKRWQLQRGNCQDENRDHLVCVTHVQEFKLHVNGMRSYWKILFGECKNHVCILKSLAALCVWTTRVSLAVRRLTGRLLPETWWVVWNNEMSVMLWSWWEVDRFTTY